MATNGDLARRLLGAAREDELAAISVLRVEGISDAIVGFHAHQAVEKAIKAVLSAKGAEFPFSPTTSNASEASPTNPGSNCLRRSTTWKT